MQQLAPTALAQWLADASRAKPVLLDVRWAEELEICALPGITHIPMDQIPARAGELDADQDIVCICHHGGRSQQAAEHFRELGHREVYNITGGIDAWADIDGTIPKY